jgi:hypothetical protein
MQYKLVFLFALLVVCSQAATLGETNGNNGTNGTNGTALYSIDNKRFNTLVERLKATNGSEHKTYHLLNAFGSFAFTCDQLTTIFYTYPFQTEILAAMPLIKDNVIDPRNYATFFKLFSTDVNKQNATKTLSAINPCKVQGVAPEKFPAPILPIKDQWNQADLETLIKNINKVYNSDEKLRIAQNALRSSSNLLSSEQTVMLYDSFANVADMLSLTEIIKEKIVGLSCDQVITLLNQRFFFDDMKLQALEAFKAVITDAENKLNILDSFGQPRAQALASKILIDLKPKNFLFGNPAGNVLFLIDISGSMDTNFTTSTGEKMTRFDFVKTEIAKTLNGLDDSSQFNVLGYASGVKIWKGYGLQKATKENIASAVNFTNHLIAYGGTNIHSTLQLAWSFSGVNTIYLLTDGSPSEGVVDTSNIVNDVRAWYSKTPVKVNSIALVMGKSIYTEDKPAAKKLMSAIADATAGNYRVLESDK